MDDLVYKPVAILGGVFMLVHFVICARRKTRPDIAVIISCMLSSSGIVAGFVLGASTFLPKLQSKLASLNIYILIAAIAIIFVSVQSLIRDFGTRRPTP